MAILDDEQAIHEEPRSASPLPVTPTDAPTSPTGVTFEATAQSSRRRTGDPERRTPQRKQTGIPGVSPPPVNQAGKDEWDYTVKYPEKPEPYHELDDNSRAWRMYNDEADMYNEQMVGDMASSLDMLLLFAALFASVLTTFVAQTSQALQQNDSGITVSLLTELVQLQRAQMTGMSSTDITPADTVFEATTTDKWVNGLWFASLVLSLITALLAVLAKQWLRQFESPRRGNPRQRAHIHHVRLKTDPKRLRPPT